MALILVVEQEGRYIERIRDALGAEGWRSQVVSGHPEALRAASSEAPSLVLVNSELEGAGGVFATFARSNGGPGVVAMVPERLAAESASVRLAADEVLAKPFTDQDLRLVVRRVLSGTRQPGRPPVPPAPAGADAGAKADAKFTSAQIFGDLVQEIENEIAGAPPETPESAASPASPAPAASSPVVAEAPPPQPEPPSPPPQAAEPPPPQAPAAARPSRPLDDAEIERRLEQTLSGVFGKGRAPTAPAPPRRRHRDVDVEQLLNETLSELDLGKERFGAAPAAAPPSPPPVPTASVAAPTPPPAEFRPLFGDFDLGELEELVRPSQGPVAPEVSEPEPEPPAAAERLAAAAPESDEPSRAFEWTPAERGSFTLDPPPPLAETPAAEPEAALTATDRFEQFGQYALLERIAVGGMAEVWKARMRGVEGFQKTVAIKQHPPPPHRQRRLRLRCSSTRRSWRRSSATPTSSTSTTSARSASDYYIAMEYVEGKDLRAILNARPRRGCRCRWAWPADRAPGWPAPSTTPTASATSRIARWGWSTATCRRRTC